MIQVVMMDWIVYDVRDGRLRPWVERYLVRRGPALKNPMAVRVFPRTGSSLFLDFGENPSVAHRDLRHAINGIHETHYFLPLKSGVVIDQMIVDFSTLGLSRFTDIPADLIKGGLVDAGLVFSGRTNPFRTLFERMQMTSTEFRIPMLEDYLITRFRRLPSGTDLLAYLTEEMRRKGKFHSTAEIERLTSTGIRQMERRFKQVAGLSRRSLGALFRFERAKTMLEKAGFAARLTDIAHASGYYDQPQFTKDIRTRSGLLPGEFVNGKPVCLELPDLHQGDSCLFVGLPGPLFSLK